MKKGLFNIGIIWTVILLVSLSQFNISANCQEITLYIAKNGSDAWSGALSSPNADGKDGPFASLERARDAVRDLKSSGELNHPVTIQIREGTYYLDKPFVLDVSDSGSRQYPITYEAYPGEKPVISGGKKISEPWKNYNDKIKVCFLKEVKEGTWYFRQLFLNDERQVRARTPNEGYFKIDETDEDLGKSSFKYRENDIKNWNNLNDVEIVIFHSWNESRLLISEMAERERIVTFTGPIGRRLESGDRLNRYFIENALEGLDQPGEWYLDRHSGNLYYWPTGAIEQAELAAPVLTRLMKFQGDINNEKYVQYINISGLTFAHADWTLPEEGIPTIRDVGDIAPPSAVTLNGARYCMIKNNCIRNVGTYALEITGDGNQITENEIYDTGSGGIITRSYGIGRNVISYNHIHHCGKVYFSGVAVNVDDGGGLVSHNLIHDISQTGVYGRHWATDYQLGERRNQEQGLIIEYNEIYNVMQNINDGGGIFIRDSNITIRNNVIHDVTSHDPDGSPGWGIYLGCETRNSRIENNIVYRNRAGLHVWYSNRNNVIENNIFVNGEKRGQIHYHNPADRHHENIRFLRNIVYYTLPNVHLFQISGESSAPVESDYNILYNGSGKQLTVDGMPGISSFENWQIQGFDIHSIVADPMFVDPGNDDYSLKPDSPAFKLGFEPIDISRVGLNGSK